MDKELWELINKIIEETEWDVSVTENYVYLINRWNTTRRSYRKDNKKIISILKGYVE